MAKQASSFESGLTRMAMGLAVAPGAVALWLIWLGLSYINKFPGARNLPWLFVFSILPLFFGVAMLAVAVMVLKKNLGRKVTISPEGFAYTDASGSFVLKWALTAFSLPRGGKLYRVMAITDGKHVVKLEELFFPDFDEIVKQVVEAKGARR